MWSEELSLQQDDDSLLVSKFSVREMLSAGPARRRGEEVRRAEPVAGRLLPAPEEGVDPTSIPVMMQVLRLPILACIPG